MLSTIHEDGCIYCPVFCRQYHYYSRELHITPLSWFTAEHGLKQEDISKILVIELEKYVNCLQVYVEIFIFFRDFSA